MRYMAWRENLFTFTPYDISTANASSKRIRKRPVMPRRSSIQAFKNTRAHDNATRNRMAPAGRISSSAFWFSQLFFLLDLSPRNSDPLVSLAPARDTIQPSTALTVEKLNVNRRSMPATASGSRSTKALKTNQAKATVSTHAPARDHHSLSSSPVILLLTPTDRTPTEERIKKKKGTPKHA